MIIDTIYLLPLARIAVATDLLKAIVEGDVRSGLDLSDVKVSLISIFELQAKAAKLGVNPRYVSEAVDVIFKVFRVIPFYRGGIIERAHELRRLIRDYVDCIVVATAICLGEDLATEDRVILSMRDRLEEEYGVEVLRYKELVGG